MAQATKSIEVGKNKDPLLRAFLELREIHGMFEEAARQLEQGIGRPICIPNCGLCCEHNTPTWMTIEAMLAVSMMTGLQKLKGATEIAEGWLYEKDTGFTIYEGMPKPGKPSPKLVEEWEMVNKGRCPFLTSEKQCFIWEARPIACRAFGVTRDAELCPRPRGIGESLNVLMVVEGSPIRDALRQFKEHCKAHSITWTVFGAVPTMFYRAAQERKAKDIALGTTRIPTAKLIGTPFDISLVWQPQIDALRAGLPAKVIVNMR